MPVAAPAQPQVAAAAAAQPPIAAAAAQPPGAPAAQGYRVKGTVEKVEERDDGGERSREGGERSRGVRGRQDSYDSQDDDSR